MAIVVQCECGKRMGLSDALAGKTAKCPACGRAISVPGSGGASRAGGGKAAARGKPAASPKIYISTGKIIAAGSLLLVVVLGAMFYFGPVRVWNQWEDVGPKVQQQIADVIEFAMKAYLSQQGMYNPAKDSHGPAVDSDDVHFFRPTLVMRMPESITFFGASSQGKFQGHYHPATGEIDADVQYGGMTFGGAVALAKATGQVHITGREKTDGSPEAELNGVPLKIVFPDTSDQ